MLQQSAAACVPNLGFNWQDNPIYQTMPAPYIWYEPSLPQYWRMTDTDNGSLYNLGTLQPATFGTSPFYPVQRTTWTPPGGGTAQYMVKKETLIEDTYDSLEVAPASDYTTGVTLVAMMNMPGTAGSDNSVLVGIGGVAFTYKFSNIIAPGIYPSGDLTYNSSGIGTGVPASANFTCYIATFQEVNVLGTLFTRMQVYKNGTLITTGDLGYSMSSYAASKDVQIFGANLYNVGSILRFNYLLGQTEVTTVTNYMRTIWGTLA
jgi:hypothetical protein